MAMMKEKFVNGISTVETEKKKLVKMLTSLRFACDSRLGRYQNLSHQDAVDFPLHMLAWSGEYFEQLLGILFVRVF